MQITLVAKAFHGIRAAVAVLILNAARKLRKSVKLDAAAIALIVGVAAVELGGTFFGFGLSSILLILVGAVVGIVLAVAGGISTLGGAANWLVKLVQVLKAPNAEQDKRLALLEKHMKEVDSFLETDKARLDSVDESTRVTQRALLALLAHGIDGNHQTQMEEAKLELELHLIRT